jgi:hypothetical protein
MPGAAAIPIIDISADGADELEVAKALVDAAAEHGFVYIKNSGKDISAKQIEHAFSVVRIPICYQPATSTRSLGCRSAGTSYWGVSHQVANAFQYTTCTP